MNFSLNQKLLVWKKNESLNENGEDQFYPPALLEKVRVQDSSERYLTTEGQERVGAVVIYSSIKSLSVGDRFIVNFNVNFGINDYLEYPILDYPPPGEQFTNIFPESPFINPFTRTIAAESSSPSVDGRQTLYKFIAE